MNARFWQLVEQADDEGGDDPDIRDEVFATLIIQECVDIANKNRTAMEMDRNTQLTATAIKQHFGVEA